MKKIFISDVSLRLLKEEGKTALSFKEKLEIAKRLSELSVDAIELLPAESDKADDVLIKTVCAVVKKPIISCTVKNTEEETERAFSLISGAAKKRLVVSVPVSPVQMEYCAKIKPAAVIERIKLLTKKAASLCDDVEVSFEDATRAEPEFLFGAIKTAVESGAKTITLTDLAGTILPSDFAEFIAKIRSSVPEIGGVSLCVQPSDEFAMGTASALAALIAGADGLKIAAAVDKTLPSAENVVRVIDNLGARKGLDCGLNKTAAGRIVKNIKDVVSGRVQNSESVSGAEKLPQKLEEKELYEQIKKLGYELSSEDEKKVYEEYLRLSEKKEVNAKDLEAIIAISALQVPATYTLISFGVTSSNVLSSTACVTLKKGEEELKGVAMGNGPVDAAFLAIENVIGRKFELDSFDLGAVTEGKEALGQAIVKLRHGGAIYSGRGVSTDIIGASIRAYISALNKVAYEEDNK